MSDWLIVLLNIAAMFLVILAGWVARRRGYLNAETTGTLSRFVVDLTMPAMVFTQMLRTVDPARLRASWFEPLLGAGIFLLGLLLGLLFLPLCKTQDQRGTCVFLIAVANWIYLPLPIVHALYGDDGVRTILLFNIGAQVVLWSVGVWTLQGGKPNMKSLRELAKNPGLIATALGILIALLIPASRTLESIASWYAPSLGAVGKVVSTHSPFAFFCSTGVLALVMIGSLTIPLSLIVTGAQLGGLVLADQPASPRLLPGVLVGRLLLTPLVLVLLVWFSARCGLVLPHVTLMTCYIVAAMPVAVSCSIFTDRFGGDTPLAARSIFYSTLLSIITVPGIIYIIQHASAVKLLP